MPVTDDEEFQSLYQTIGSKVTLPLPKAKIPGYTAGFEDGLRHAFFSLREYITLPKAELNTQDSVPGKLEVGNP
jgi:hypothetical protein